MLTGYKQERIIKYTLFEQNIDILFQSQVFDAIDEPLGYSFP